MHLVTTGIQWCGKGTQARLLQENFGFEIIEMWAVFRSIAASGSELWNTLKEIMDSWAQVPWELGIKIMQEAVNRNLDKQNIIFDAFVRNDWNKKIFDETLPNYKVLFFELDTAKAKSRLLGRMYDPISWETFTSEIKTNPKTGTTLVKRWDDKDESAILKRIQEFEEKTLPIVELQKKEWRVVCVNADQSIDNVYKEIVEKLDLQ